MKNPALARTASYGFLTACQNLEKANDPMPRKRLGRRTDGWKGTRGPKKTSSKLNSICRLNYYL